jgi:hypothetical protein
MTQYHSPDAADFRIQTEKSGWLCTLTELFPAEIAFFKQRFVWSSNKSGCYVRHRYEKLEQPCEKPIPKWVPLKTRGEWQHLYPELVDSLVEKHLSFEKFYKLHSYRDRLSPNADETAFWFGTMAGEKTYNDCIDLDSHDQMGWNPLPTMWHSSRTGSVNGPYSWRYVPVMRPTLRFFQMAKLIYDHFPNRIWAFSSANFGLAVWKVHARPELTHVVYRKVEASLRAAGLNVEHYPTPAKTGLGKCHRRPCGMDSAVITDNGLITESIQQVRLYMSPPPTPSFQTILEACFEGLRRSYDHFMSEGESISHIRMPKDEKKILVESCLEGIEVVRAWAKGGYQIDRELISEQGSVASTSDNSELYHIKVSSEELCDTNFSDSIPVDDYPAFFWQVDLRAVAQSGQWVQFTKFLVETGIPVEDKLSEVVSALALWFGFVELFGQDRDRIKNVLRTFVLIRHNEKVSRLLAGQTEDVVSHVDRIVDHVLENETAEGKQVFAEIRQKRATSQYKKVYFSESQILRVRQDSISQINETDIKSYLICRGLISDSKAEEAPSEWNYEPDDTPLPEVIMNRIVVAFRESKRQLRKNKSGKHHTLDSITRLFNYLFCGRKCGTRRAGRDLLAKMGLPKKTSELSAVITILTENGLLYKGGYLSGTHSRQWMLDKSVVEAMQNVAAEIKRA